MGQAMCTALGQGHESPGGIHSDGGAPRRKTEVQFPKEGE